MAFDTPQNNHEWVNKAIAMPKRIITDDGRHLAIVDWTPRVAVEEVVGGECRVTVDLTFHVDVVDKQETLDLDTLLVAADLLEQGGDAAMGVELRRIREAVQPLPKSTSVRFRPSTESLITAFGPADQPPSGTAKPSIPPPVPPVR